MACGINTKEVKMNSILWWNVNVGVEAEVAVARAVRDRSLTMGKIVAEFERRIAETLNIPHVICVMNGTNALMLALLEAGVGAGDEVIVPDRTWIATAHAAYLLGAKVVLVNVEKEKPLICPSAFAEAITPRTKAVIPVHLNGRNCNMPSIREIAERHNIAVIEDAAQALFSKSKEGGFLGTHSRAGCFSLSVAKLIPSGQGGFVVTHCAKIAERLRLMRTHGTNDIINAQWKTAGGNFRMTDLHAAIALTQLDKTQEWIENIMHVYCQYESALSNDKKITLLPVDYANGEIPIYVEVLLAQRGECMRYLSAQGIQTRPMYADLRSAPQFQPQKIVSPSIYATDCLTLPCGPSQTEQDIQTVLTCLQKWSNSNGVN